MKVYTPPTYAKLSTEKSIFLAGSIEMGAAEQWQTKAIDYFKNLAVVFNPRRDDWDSSLKQDLNCKGFYEQVVWELDHLNKCDVVYMYFDPNTKSPITMLELGLFAHSDKMVVCCPHGFWRKGNVDVVCQYYNIPMYTDFDTSLFAAERLLKK